MKKITDFRLQRIKREKAERERIIKTNRKISLVTMWLILFIAFYILWNSLLTAKKIDEGVDINTPRLPGAMEIVKPIKVAAEGIDPHSTALGYIRHRGEELGYSNQEVSRMIRIARCESGYKLNPNAKNPNSTATGIFQIVIGTWDGNRCEGERWDYIDNIDCAYKIYSKRGTQPWNASKACWDK